MNRREILTNTWKFIKNEKFEIITIIITTIAFHIAADLLPEHAQHHQDLASYMPSLVIVAPIALFASKFVMLYKKTGLMRHWEIVQPLKDRHYNSKLVVTVFNASTFLLADIILVYAFAMSFFAFAFNAGTETFPEAWNQVRIAEIAFPLLSLFGLVCMRRRR